MSPTMTAMFGVIGGIAATIPAIATAYLKGREAFASATVCVVIHTKADRADCDARTNTFWPSGNRVTQHA